jgi:hypothetical protein
MRILEGAAPLVLHVDPVGAAGGFYLHLLDRGLAASLLHLQRPTDKANCLFTLLSRSMSNMLSDAQLQVSWRLDLSSHYAEDTFKIDLTNISTSWS